MVEYERVRADFTSILFPFMHTNLHINEKRIQKFLFCKIDYYYETKNIDPYTFCNRFSSKRAYSTLFQYFSKVLTSFAVLSLCTKKCDYYCYCNNLSYHRLFLNSLCSDCFLCYAQCRNTKNSASNWRSDYNNSNHIL